MYRMLQVFVIATPFLVVTACMADDGTGSTDDPATQSASRGEASAAVPAVGTSTVAWAVDTVDPAQVGDTASCMRLKSFNDTSCPDNYVCLWQNASGTDGKVGFGVASPVGCRILNFTNITCQIKRNGTTHHYTCAHGNGTFNDEMSAWANNTGESFCWFFDANFQSTAVGMPPQTVHDPVVPANNDQASSLRPASQGC